MAADNQEDSGRPRRRCASRHATNRNIPSAIHYVGYVEDGETPEMIMRKFEELERIKQQQQQDAPQQDAQQTDQAQPTDEANAAAAPAPDADPPPAGLTDEQLLEVFKQTSMFNVRTALQNNDALLDNPDGAAYSDEELWSDEDGEYMAGFWSDEDGAAYAQHWRELRRRHKGRKGSGAPRQAAPQRSRHVMHYNAASQAFIRRKMKVVDEDVILQLRIPPPPLPLAWARTVMPYIPKHLYGTAPQYIPTVRGDLDTSAAAAAPTAPAVEGTEAAPAAPPASVQHVVSDIGTLEPATLQCNYLAVLVNPGWEAGQPAEKPRDPDAHIVSKLSALHLHRACPSGFVFIWVDKQHIAPVMDLMYRWKFVYVENLNWLYLGANNELLSLPADYFGRSHLTLFIFRKDGAGKDIELRHQRNPDVFFDCVQGDGAMPPETYVTIETLLPTAKGRLLELWAPAGVQRPGWTHYVEQRS